MRAVAGADFTVTNDMEKAAMNFPTVIPSEVEEPRVVAVGSFAGSFDSASLGMT